MPCVVEDGVVHVVGVQLGQGGPGLVPGHEEGVVAAAGGPGGHHPGHPDAGLLRHQQQVGPVLDLVPAVPDQVRARALVPDRPPQLAEEAGVPGVAADDGDSGVGPRRRASPGSSTSARARGATAGRTARGPRSRRASVDLLGRGRPRRRPGDQVDQGGDPPAESDAAEDVGQEALHRQHRAHRAHEEHHVDQPAGGAGEVRRGDEEDRDGGRQPDRGEAGRLPRTSASPAALRAEPGSSTARTPSPISQVRRAAAAMLGGQADVAADDEGAHQGDGDGDRADEVDDPEGVAQPVRQVGDQLERPLAEVAGVAGQPGRGQDDDRDDDDGDDVARSPADRPRRARGRRSSGRGGAGTAAGPSTGSRTSASVVMAGTVRPCASRRDARGRASG